jgi:methionyl-tRNA synthetase
MNNENENILYLTTPLYYVNANPHLGHAYTTILADVLKKHYSQRGFKVVFLTGTDEHGEKIEQTAKQKNYSPLDFVNEQALAFKKTWDEMELSYDIFYRTTDSEHKRKVQYALNYLKEKGEIVFREYEGLYCVGCERFLKETELTSDGLCPDHLKAPVQRKESNYFFLMSKYQEKLIEVLNSKEDLIVPAHYKNEIISFLRQPLEDLCVSRPKSRLTWGIELPFDKDYVTYVWFDALLNYLCATGWPDKFNEKMWKSAHHLIAKDILKTHAVYWPTMLMALGVPLYNKLVVHGYWLIDGSKMSKSLGNVVRPQDIEAQYGKDTMRFYLLREMSFGLDSTFKLENFITAINAYLANGIGNLVSRVLTLCLKNFKGEFLEDKLIEIDNNLLSKRKVTLDIWKKSFDEFKFHEALKAWSDLVTEVDLYVNETKPWALAKDPAQAERLQVVLGVCLELIYSLSVMIYPVLPRASQLVLKSIGVNQSSLNDLDSALDIIKHFHLEPQVPKLFLRINF